MAKSHFPLECAAHFAAILARAAAKPDHVAPEKTPDAAIVITLGRKGRSVGQIAAILAQARDDAAEFKSEPVPAPQPERPQIMIRRRRSR